MKDCPENKILNPKTNRCVLKNGKIGKTLIHKKKKGISKLEIIKTKNNLISCPNDKIKNPETNRCVKKNGSIGKKIMERIKVKQAIMKKTKLSSSSSKKTTPKKCKISEIFQIKTNSCVKKSKTKQKSKKKNTKISNIPKLQLQLL